MNFFVNLIVLTKKLIKLYSHKTHITEMKETLGWKHQTLLVKMNTLIIIGNQNVTFISHEMSDCDSKWYGQTIIISCCYHPTHMFT